MGLAERVGLAEGLRLGLAVGDGVAVTVDVLETVGEAAAWVGVRLDVEVEVGVLGAVGVADACRGVGEAEGEPVGLGGTDDVGVWLGLAVALGPGE